MWEELSSKTPRDYKILYCFHIVHRSVYYFKILRNALGMPFLPTALFSASDSKTCWRKLKDFFPWFLIPFRQVVYTATKGRSISGFCIDPYVWFSKPIKHLTVSRWDYYLLIQDYWFHWWYVCSLAIDFQTLERVKTMFITKLQNPYCVLSIVIAICSSPWSFIEQGLHLIRLMFSLGKCFYYVFRVHFSALFTVDLKLFVFCIFIILH